VQSAREATGSYATREKKGVAAGVLFGEAGDAFGAGMNGPNRPSGSPQRIIAPRSASTERPSSPLADAIASLRRE